MNILLRSIRLIDPTTAHDAVVDIHIVNGVIEKIAPKISAPSSAEVFDMRGKICAPGFFDMHVHFREPGNEGAETIASGIACAAASGFTGVMMMPNTTPPIDSAAMVRSVLRGGKNSPVDLYTSGCITKARAGVELAPMGSMMEAGARAFTDDGAAVMSAGVMRRAFEYASMFDVPLIQHAEDHTLTDGGCMHEGIVSAQTSLPGMPSVAEEIIVARDLLLGGYIGDTRYHVAHISTAGSVELVRSAKRNKLSVTAEVTPHHFSLTDEAVQSFDTNARMNPPLRSRDDLHALLDGLRDGTIDCIATDHAPHAPHTKSTSFSCAPFGIIGLETAVGLCVTNLINKKILSWPRLIEAMSVNPRKILKLDAINISKGAPANFTIIDPKKEWIVGEDDLKSKSKNTPFFGIKLTGKAMGIVLREHVVIGS